MRPSIWQSPQDKSGIVLVSLWAISSTFWLKGISFAGLIAGIFLLTYSILLFKKPNKFAYRTFIFWDKCFDTLFEQSQRYFAIALGIIACIQILLHPSNLSIGLIGVTFFGSLWGIALRYLTEVRQLQQKDIYINIVQKITIWLILIVSSIFVVLSLVIVFINVIEMKMRT